MVLANSCRCGVGGKTIRLSGQRSRVRNPAPLSFFPVLCFLFVFSFFLSTFEVVRWCPLHFFFFHGNKPPTCFGFLFFFCTWGVVSSVCMFFFFFATRHPHVITNTAWTHHHCVGDKTIRLSSQSWRGRYSALLFVYSSEASF